MFKILSVETNQPATMTANPRCPNVVALTRDCLYVVVILGGAQASRAQQTWRPTRCEFRPGSGPGMAPGGQQALPAPDRSWPLCCLQPQLPVLRLPGPSVQWELSNLEGSELVKPCCGPGWLGGRVSTHTSSTETPLWPVHPGAPSPAPTPAWAQLGRWGRTQGRGGW